MVCTTRIRVGIPALHIYLLPLEIPIWKNGLKFHFYSKTCWKKEVWLRAWKIENEEWGFHCCAVLWYILPEVSSPWCQVALCLVGNINQTPGVHTYVWEHRSIDLQSELSLKSDSIEYKGTLLSVRACEGCDDFCEENVEHVIMQCNKHNKLDVTWHVS